MSAIERLKEKIEAIRANHHAVQTELTALKEELASAGSHNEELEALKNQLTQKDEQIVALRNELQEKDTEIEAIIAKVETLLS